MRLQGTSYVEKSCQQLLPMNNEPRNSNQHEDFFANVALIPQEWNNNQMSVQIEIQILFEDSDER